MITSAAPTEKKTLTYSVSDHACDKLLERGGQVVAGFEREEAREWLDLAVVVAVRAGDFNHWDDVSREQKITAVWMMGTTGIPMVAVLTENNRESQIQSYAVLTMLTERMANQSIRKAKWKPLQNHFFEVPPDPKTSLGDKIEEAVRNNVIELPQLPPPAEAPTFHRMIAYVDADGQLVVEPVLDTDNLEKILLDHAAAGRKVQLFRPQLFRQRAIIEFGD